MGMSRRRWAERAEYDPLDPSKQHEPVTAGKAVSGLVDAKMAAGASEVGRALSVWRGVCGKRVARHTVAVWLSQPKEGEMPELVVYLDGNTLMADLTTDAEMYQERLSFAGLEVQRVKFRLSRKAGQASEQPKQRNQEPVANLPDLSSYERAQVAQATSVIKDAKMREAASEAMENSLRRAKLETTPNGKPNP